MFLDSLTAFRSCMALRNANDGKLDGAEASDFRFHAYELKTGIIAKY